LTDNYINILKGNPVFSAQNTGMTLKGFWFWSLV